METRGIYRVAGSESFFQLFHQFPLWNKRILPNVLCCSIILNVLWSSILTQFNYGFHVVPSDSSEVSSSITFYKEENFFSTLYQTSVYFVQQQVLYMQLKISFLSFVWLPSVPIGSHWMTSLEKEFLNFKLSKKSFCSFH